MTSFAADERIVSALSSALKTFMAGHMVRTQVENGSQNSLKQYR